MIGAVDAATGAVTRVVTGSGLELQELTRHPDTGESLEGFRIPDVDKIRRALPGRRPRSFPASPCRAGISR